MKNYSHLSEFRKLYPTKKQQTPTKGIAISLLIPCKGASHSLEETVKQAHSFFYDRFQNTFEIILIPTELSNTHKENNTVLQIAQALTKKCKEVKVCIHIGPLGKGAALRTGFLSSQGAWICFTDADLPYDLSFFDNAISDLKNGVALVTGNRRLQESMFQLPVSLLPLAYSRHRLGLWFNKAARLFLPIHTTDTQSGIKALTRELAELGFYNLT
ncbi:MAG: glycosyltransferase family 2 protein, partial [Deltaproteobacteria bacterium]|nr:glycosyltransferase family 2 protein [Deltaproteobacteria bacterium]